MARIVDPIKLDNAIELYLSGKTSQEAATLAGIAQGTLLRGFKARGIETRTSKITIPTDTLRDMYVVQGMSELQVAEALGISRTAVRRNLIEAGIDPRGSRQAGLVRAAKMTPEERLAQAAAAHDAARGRTRSLEERIEFAKIRESDRGASPDSVGEDLMLELLKERGLEPIPQKAVGPYNLDFAIGPVAVEVLGGTWHAGSTRHTKRTPYILNEGWLLVFVWNCHGSRLTSGAADYIVALLEETRRNPSLIGEYRVIRGDGELLTAGRVEDDNFTLVQPSVRRLDIGA